MARRLKKGVKIISADELAAEWFKDPEFVREYEALEQEYAEIYRQIRAKDARRARRTALLARAHEFWHWLVNRADRVPT